MLILNSQQVIPCYVQLREEETYLLGFTYLNQPFIKTESYDQNQQEKALRRTRQLLDQDYCCVVLRHGENCSLWCAAPAEAKVVQKTNNQKEYQQGLSNEFIDFCQQILANYIGPMAKWVNEEALEKLSSSATREHYIKALASEIPDPKQAQEFMDRVRKQ